MGVDDAFTRIVAQQETEATISQAENALKLAMEYALGSVHSDGYWCGELKSNVTVTAEYIFLRQAFGLVLTSDLTSYCRYLLSQQNDDGSWGPTPDYPGDVSTTTEAYLTLKVLGTSTDLSPMQRSREFVLQNGGVAAVRVFTRISLAILACFHGMQFPSCLSSSFCCPLCVRSISTTSRLGLAAASPRSYHLPSQACLRAPKWNLVAQ